MTGILTISSEPKNVYVEAINEKSIHVFWQKPDQLADKVKNYIINITKLHTFDQYNLSDVTMIEQSIKVESNQMSVVINNLQPLTMYEVFVISQNNFGSSLPSIRVRTLTLDNSSGIGGKISSGTLNNRGVVVPKLPGKVECVLFLIYFVFFFVSFVRMMIAPSRANVKEKHQRIKLHREKINKYI